jgi:hypothetical protein
MLEISFGRKDSFTQNFSMLKCITIDFGIFCCLTTQCIVAAYGYLNNGFSLAHQANVDFTTADNDRNSSTLAITSTTYPWNAKSATWVGTEH